MGCGSLWACKTCKVRLFVGYGSYGRHEERIQRWAPQAEHDGHDTFDWIDDYEYGVEGDVLYGMGSYGSRGAPILEGVSDYTYRDLQAERDEEYRRANPPKPLAESVGNAEVDRKLKAWEARTRK